MENKSDNDISFIRYSGIDDIDLYYKFIDQIGAGSFGIVYKAKSLSDGAEWAIKRTERIKTTYSQWEVHLLSKMKHTNIVFVKELIETDKYSFMVMEFCKAGSMKDQFEKNNIFNEPEIKHIMNQFAEAIRYLHNRHIAHRDLKMENLLLQLVGNLSANYKENRFVNYSIKLIDFGLSIQVNMVDGMMLDYCGTPLYMSPEIIMGNRYSKQCDIWSMGIIMYSLMLGKLPFSRSDSLENDILKFDITSNTVQADLNKFSTQSIDALRGLLHPDPSHRSSASEFLNVPWFSGNDRQQTTNILQLMKKVSDMNKSIDRAVISPITTATSQQSTCHISYNVYQSKQSKDPSRNVTKTLNTNNKKS